MSSSTKLAGEEGEIRPPNETVGQIVNQYGTQPVDKINDATNLMEDYRTIVADRYNGNVYATSSREYHADLIRILGGDEDNYVRLSSSGKHIEVSVNSAGVVIRNDSDEERAINNIYRILDRLVNLGLPKDTPIKIFRTQGRVIQTTAKMYRLRRW